MRELDSKTREHVQMLHRKRAAVRKNEVERISGGRRKIEGGIQAEALEDVGWQPPRQASEVWAVRKEVITNHRYCMQFDIVLFPFFCINVR